MKKNQDHLCRCNIFQKYINIENHLKFKMIGIAIIKDILFNLILSCIHFKFVFQ